MRSNKIVFIALLLFLGVLSTSCKDEGYSLDKYWVGVGTVDSVDRQVHSLTLDGGTTLWVAASDAYYSSLRSGQRVMVNFTILSDRQGGYDHYIRLNRLDTLLTKNVIPLTAGNADSIGNDKVKVLGLYTGGDCLNVHFEFRYGDTRKHMVNLVQNTTKTYPANDTLYLEFRHNAYSDPGNRVVEGFVSFRIKDKIKPGHETLPIVVRFTEFEGVKDYKAVYKPGTLEEATPTGLVTASQEIVGVQ